ncbi:MAG: VWA domain-containing protein [Clostridiales bacterium]|nr:VWA domain-containing protein [Clostridiales bacterium]
MVDNRAARLEDLISNPTARVPVCLCLDTSRSMEGEPIKRLNEGLKLFYEAIRRDETAAHSAEISIATFGGRAQLIEDFANIERQMEPPVLVADGRTPMGEAVILELDCLESRKQEYRDKGLDYYQPWFILMTDGVPNGSQTLLAEAITRTYDLVSSRRIAIFPIGIGDEADMKVLKKFSPSRDPVRLKGLKFKEFFEWLGKGVSKATQTTPGEKVLLDFEGIKSWGEL